VAEGLTVHHNLLPHYQVPRESWDDMTRLWPPKLPDLLSALEASSGLDVGYHLSREQITAFYLEAATLRLETAGSDPYSFLAREPADG
jgi:hypothetical protein